MFYRKTSAKVVVKDGRKYIKYHKLPRFQSDFRVALIGVLVAALALYLGFQAISFLLVSLQGNNVIEEGPSE